MSKCKGHFIWGNINIFSINVYKIIGSKNKALYFIYPILSDLRPGSYTLGSIMFGTFGSVWCKTALAEVGVSLP